jgi:Holliday junction resolvase RusA-like endonuclease
MNKILLNVVIPGKPYSQQRHRWGNGRVYDPSSRDKASFMWELKAACPMLKPDLTARIAVRLTIYTSSWTEDADNYLKFYMDAISAPKSRSRHKIKLDHSKSFCAWENDNQVDEVNLKVYRGCQNERVEIFIYTLDDLQKSLAENGECDETSTP